MNNENTFTPVKPVMTGVYEPCEPITEARGIYNYSNETREVLSEVLEMLCRFRREVGYYDVETKEARANEPTCFKDEVAMIHALAFAIKGDLLRIMKEFG